MVDKTKAMLAKKTNATFIQFFFLASTQFNIPAEAKKEQAIILINLVFIVN